MFLRPWCRATLQPRLYPAEDTVAAALCLSCVSMKPRRSRRRPGVSSWRWTTRLHRYVLRRVSPTFSTLTNVAAS